MSNSEDPDSTVRAMSSTLAAEIDDLVQAYASRAPIKRLLERSGASRTQLHNWRHNNNTPDRVSLDGLLRALDVDMASPQIMRLQRYRHHIEAHRRMRRSVRGSSHRTSDRPPPGRDLIGRRDDLADLDALLSRTDSEDTIVVNVTGSPGTGRHALANLWARRNLDQFPDGVYVCNVADHGPLSPGLSQEAAITSLLSNLGFQTEYVSPLPDERAEYLRDVIRDRRIVVILTDVRNPALLTAIDPVTSNSRIIVTSVRPLRCNQKKTFFPGLTLEPLSTRHSVELVATRTGIPLEQVAQPPILDGVVACGGLPVLLNLLTTRVVESFGVTPIGGTRTTGAVKDPQWEPTRAEISRRILSTLDEETRTLFELVQLAPLVDVAVGTAAALVDSSPEQTSQQLAVLVRIGLLVQRGSGRVQVRQPFLSMPVSESGTRKDFSDQSAPINRLLAHYVAIGRLINDRSQANDERGHTEAANVARLASVLATTAPEKVMEVCQTWEGPLQRLGRLEELLSVESATLAASQLQANIRLEVETLALIARIREKRGEFDLALPLARRAATLAGEIGHLKAQHTSIMGVAVCSTLVGDHSAAKRALDHALDISRQLGPQERVETLINLGIHLERRPERAVEARVLYLRAHHIAANHGLVLLQAKADANLGVVAERLGNYSEALTYQSEALRGFESQGDPFSRAITVSNIGVLHQALGDLGKALRSFQRAQDLSTLMGDRTGVGVALINEAEVRVEMQQPVEALASASLGLDCCHDVAEWTIQAHIVSSLALAQIEGRSEESLASAELALTLCDTFADGALRAKALNAFGTCLRDAGLPTKAIEQHRLALQVARSCEQGPEVAQAHVGLAAALSAFGKDVDLARGHWHEAADVFSDMGLHARADQARSRCQGVGLSQSTATPHDVPLSQP